MYRNIIERLRTYREYLKRIQNYTLGAYLSSQLAFTDTEITLWEAEMANL